MPFQTTHVHFTSNLKPTVGKYYAVLTTRTTAGPTSGRGSCPMSWSVLKRHGHFQFSNKILHEKKGSRQNLCGGAVQGCICQLRYVYSICAVVNCTAWCTAWYWGVILVPAGSWLGLRCSWSVWSSASSVVGPRIFFCPRHTPQLFFLGLFTAHKDTWQAGDC